MRPRLAIGRGGLRLRDDPAELPHRVFDRIRPRVAVVQPDKIRKFLFGGKDGPRRDADALFAGAPKQFERVDPGRKLDPQQF